MASWRFGIMAERQPGVAVVHIRFEGRSLDIPQSELDIGPASSDHEIKRVLARYLEVPESKLRDYVVDRHDTGNLNTRATTARIRRKFRVYAVNKKLTSRQRAFALV